MMNGQNGHDGRDGQGRARTGTDGHGRARTGTEGAGWAAGALRMARRWIGWWVAFGLLLGAFCWPAGVVWLAAGRLAGVGGLAVCWLGCFVWAVRCGGRWTEVCGVRLQGLGGRWYAGPCRGMALGGEAGVFVRVVGFLWRKQWNWWWGEEDGRRPVSGGETRGQGQGMGDGHGLCGREEHGRARTGTDGDTRGQAPGMGDEDPLGVVGRYRGPYSRILSTGMGDEDPVGVVGLERELARVRRRLAAMEGALGREADVHACIQRGFYEERRVLRDALGGVVGMARELGVERDPRAVAAAELLNDGREG